ncbi:hypothetical protein HZS_116 [Henneguya salminicola]|nr:hypothetical protein HZS_116 [Henneguya salminicola]
METLESQIDEVFVNRVQKILKLTRKHLIQYLTRSIKNIRVKNLDDDEKKALKINKKANEINEFKNLSFKEISIPISNRIVDLFPYSEAQAVGPDQSESKKHYITWVQETVKLIENQFPDKSMDTNFLSSVTRILTHKTFLKNIWSCHRKLYKKIKAKEIRRALNQKRKRNHKLKKLKNQKLKNTTKLLPSKNISELDNMPSVICVNAADVIKFDGDDD